MKCNREGGKLVFTFDGLESIVFDSTAATVSHEDAAMHGYEQKIRDNAAISRKQKDGTVIDVTEAMRRDAVQEMVTHLTTSTDWNMAKRAGVSAATAASLKAAIETIADLMGVSFEEAKAMHEARIAK